MACYPDGLLFTRIVSNGTLFILSSNVNIHVGTSVRPHALPARMATTIKAPVAFKAWVDAALPNLKPPVGTVTAPNHNLLRIVLCLNPATGACRLRGHSANRLLYEGALKVMIVGGPNERNDFHIEEGEVR